MQRNREEKWTRQVPTSLLLTPEAAAAARVDHNNIVDLGLIFYLFICFLALAWLTFAHTSVSILILLVCTLKSRTRSGKLVPLAV